MRDAYAVSVPRKRRKRKRRCLREEVLKCGIVICPWC
jgi:hypothetical protein